MKEYFHVLITHHIKYSETVANMFYLKVFLLACMLLVKNNIFISLLQISTIVQKVIAKTATDLTQLKKCWEQNIN